MENDRTLTNLYLAVKEEGYEDWTGEEGEGEKIEEKVKGILHHS